MPLVVDVPLNTAIADLDEALRASESRLAIVQGALRALPDGVVTVDAHGGILQLNPSAAHLIGWTESQAVGQPLHEVLQLRDAQGRTVDVLGPDSRQGHDVTSLVRRDRHEVLVDVLVTPIHGHAREVLGAVVTFRNVTAAKRISDELTYHANHDPLTGAGNRRAFEVRLQRAVAQATTRHIPHALLCLDLDRFKAVNDDGGHGAGDDMLRQLTLLLKRQLRDHDTLARMGGDEFAILLENCTSEQATSVAERIRTAVLDSRLQWHGKSLGVGISIGQVNFCDDTLSPHQLMQRADELCYQAKSGGRNRVRVDAPGKHPPGKPVRIRAGVTGLQHVVVGGSGRPRG
jgi:diguanylate cyclase (GGDEF)-like protein/PAS domain S-box-containing protein